MKTYCGNAKTNQQPSFVNAFIENVFFYLNRVGLLFQNNVIMSQPLVPEADPTQLQSTNYYRISTLTQSAADPVDLNASSIRPITLRSVQPTYQGIILFSDGEQFILFSEQGVVTPQTAIIKSISTYEMYGDVNAVELGDEYYFISRTLRHTRVFKMVPRGIQQGPQITEVTKIITDYIPNTVDTLVPNSQNGFVSLVVVKISTCISFVHLLIMERLYLGHGIHGSYLVLSSLVSLSKIGCMLLLPKAVDMLYL